MSKVILKNLELEEKYNPDDGDIFILREIGEEYAINEAYIIARIGADLFAIVSLEDGNRLSSPTTKERILSAFEDCEWEIVKIIKCDDAIIEISSKEVGNYRINYNDLKEMLDAFILDVEDLKIQLDIQKVCKEKGFDEVAKEELDFVFSLLSEIKTLEEMIKKS